MTRPIRYLLNGKPRNVGEFEPTRTLLQHLRLHERLTATKEGCAEGDCGACTVALGMPAQGGGLTFRAVNSCILPVTEIDGAVVVTAEGLADGEGHLHSAQQALVELHGSQCGFCTPGFVMSLFAFEREAADPDREEIHDMLAGNLCRCTGYRPIVAAAEAIVADGRDARFDAVALEWRAALDRMLDAPAWDDELAPRTMEALDAILAARSDVRMLSGGTDLGVDIAKYGRNPGILVSLRRVAGLDAIAEEADCLSIGATATYSAALPFLETHFPAFAEMVRRIGSLQIRNLGTMGGNICNASPIGDSAPCLIALGAEVIVRSAQGRRTIPIDEFFTAYRRTALRPGEYLEVIRIPYLAKDAIFRAYKLAKRFDQDISAVAAGFHLTLKQGRVEDVRMAFGGMAATPSRARAAEAALRGQVLDERALAAAVAALATDFKPLSDFRGSASYRLKSAGGLIARLGAEIARPDLEMEVWRL